MDEVKNKRELVGLSQIALARRAGISRMRLQLAEAGELTLRPEEAEALNRSLREAIECRASTLRSALVGQEPPGTRA
jgi:transcriptional regulator with XRE-family HTH domain